MTIGERLRNCREDLDLKQKDVALALNISNKMLSCYERDFSLPALDTFKALCEYYNTSADDILDIHIQKEEPIEKPVFLSSEQKRLLSYYEKLNRENRDAIMGLAILYSKEQKRTSPA